MARKTALITGASQGIGAEVAEALARDGYDIAVTSTRPEKLSDTAARIEGAGGKAVIIGLDVRQRASIGQAMAAAVSGLGQVDVLVNNAAVALKKPALDITPEDWDTVMDTDLGGTFFMSQEMARHLVATGRPGLIVNVASTHGLVALEERVAYGVAKAGMMHMTRMLAYEWARHGIRVNAVAPGRVTTPSRDSFLSEPGYLERMTARIPLKRFAESGEVAAAVVYLASAGAGYITGQTIVLDGGLTIY